MDIAHLPAAVATLEDEKSAPPCELSEYQAAVAEMEQIGREAGAEAKFSDDYPSALIVFAEQQLGVHVQYADACEDRAVVAFDFYHGVDPETDGYDGLKHPAAFALEEFLDAMAPELSTCDVDTFRLIATIYYE